MIDLNYPYLFVRLKIFMGPVHYKIESGINRVLPFLAASWFFSLVTVRQPTPHRNPLLCGPSSLGLCTWRLLRSVMLSPPSGSEKLLDRATIRNVCIHFWNFQRQPCWGRVAISSQGSCDPGSVSSLCLLHWRQFTTTFVPGRPPCFVVSLFSCSIVLSIFAYGLQHSRLPCPFTTSEACSTSCPSSQWCHPSLILCRCLLLPCLQSAPHSIWVFPNQSALSGALWYTFFIGILPQSVLWPAPQWSPLWSPISVHSLASSRCSCE